MCLHYEIKFSTGAFYMLNIDKTLQLNYLSLSGEMNLRGINRASPDLITKAVGVIYDSLLSPLSFISKDIHDSAPNIRRALANTSGRNAYTRFVAAGPQYYALSKTKIDVPEHLEGKLVPYVKTVAEIQVLLTAQLPNMLAALRTRIGVHYHDKAELRKPVDSFADGFINVGNLVKDLKKVMSTKNSHSQLAYGKVLDRNKDWEVISEELESIFKHAGTLDIISVDKQVKDLAELVDCFVEDRMVKEDNDISAATISNLGKAVYEVAEAVRLYGLVYSLAVELTNLDSIWQKRLAEVS